MSSPAHHHPRHRLGSIRRRGLAQPTRIAAAGLTVIELMVALAVLAVLVSQAVPSFAAQLERRRLVSASAEVASALQFARSHALVTGQPLRASVLRGDSRTCLVVHTGAVADCQCLATPVCSSGVDLERAVVLDAARGLAVQANVGSLRHDPRTGTTTPTGTVRVSLRDTAVHHVVNLGGRVRSCAPAPGLPGLASC